MRISAFKSLAILAFFPGVATASHSAVSYTITGTVAQISDSGGLFGGLRPGELFHLVYTADFEKGRITGGGGGGGGGASLSGGSYYAPDPSWPQVEVSPLSALLSISEMSIAFSGSYLGTVSITHINGQVFGGMSSSSLGFEARDGSTSTSNNIMTHLEDNFGYSFFTSGFDVPTPITFDGQRFTGSTTFDYHYVDPNSGMASLFTGSLNLMSVVSADAAVPEPSTWLMFISGFGLVGAATRRRQRTLVSHA